MLETNAPSPLPLPKFYDPDRVGQVWRVPYLERAEAAEQWAIARQIPPALEDSLRTCLLLIDVQNTFCLPDFELFVAGRSGRGAIEDNRRLCEFIYRNLAGITQIAVTMDTHNAVQVFHPVFWLDASGRHPQPHTPIRWEEVQAGFWQVNPAIAAQIFPRRPERLSAYAHHYVRHLDRIGKFPLTIWPYHSMLGGIGHSLVAAVEEAVFFHNLARCSQTRFETKGNHPLTENYSAFSPEVGRDEEGQVILPPNRDFFDYILGFDRIAIAGQAKSHCVAWTVADLLAEIQARNPAIARRIYLLEDCMSPVVVPEVVDFTEVTEASFAEFAAAGMHRTDSISLLLKQ
jgi:nicotinamidase-related amidase